MRNITKYPQNANTLTIYLTTEQMAKLEQISTMSGKKKAKIVGMMVANCLPKACMKEVIHRELSFE